MTTSYTRTTHYVYDTFGNLMSATLPNGRQIGYDYDTANRLYKVSDNMGNYVEYTLDLKGRHHVEKVYDNTSGAFLKDLQYVYDGKGNAKALVDENQAVVASYAYDPFGVLVAVSGTLDQPYRFSTKRYYADLGLNYYGFRFYDANLGRWMTRDPLGEVGGLNLYGFVGNSPVNAVDPWGLWSDHEMYGGYPETRDASYNFGRTGEGMDPLLGQSPDYGYAWRIINKAANDMWNDDLQHRRERMAPQITRSATELGNGFADIWCALRCQEKWIYFFS